jgi:hypothetical protein
VLLVERELADQHAVIAASTSLAGVDQADDVELSDQYVAVAATAELAGVVLLMGSPRSPSRPELAGVLLVECGGHRSGELLTRQHVRHQGREPACSQPLAATTTRTSSRRRSVPTSASTTPTAVTQSSPTMKSYQNKMNVLM